MKEQKFEKVVEYEPLILDYAFDNLADVVILPIRVFGLFLFSFLLIIPILQGRKVYWRKVK